MSKFFTLVIFLFITFNNVAHSQAGAINPSFVLEYFEPTEETAVYAQMLIESGIIDEAVADLEGMFALPIPITIRFGPGLDGPSYFQGMISMPYEFLMQNDLILTHTNYYETGEEALAAILNTTEFVLYHEVGHALVDVLDIPVLGKQEDAVDGFAAVLSTIWELDEIALSTADILEATAMLGSGSEITDAEFWDSHSLNEQRMFAIFCLIYGSDPQEHTTLLSDVGMPAEQHDRCTIDFQYTYRSWSRMLQGYLRE